MSNAIRIHHASLSGHAHRALVFAKLAGIAHEAIEVDLANGAHQTPEFRALNPNAQVPVIEDGDTVVHDSNAILVYLARKYAPDWMPSDPEGEAAVQRWRNIAEHRVAQSRGRSGIFKNYRLRVASVMRDYGMNERDEAPADSLAQHDG